MRGLFTRAWRDERGTAVLELGIAAPILACLVIGMTDVSNAYSRKLALEQGAQRAIEKQMQTTENDTPEDTIKSEAALQADVNVSDVTVGYNLYCDGVLTTPYSSECPPGQIEARYLIVTVSDSYRPIFPIRFGPTQADGTYLVSATAGMRTE